MRGVIIKSFESFNRTSSARTLFQKMRGRDGGQKKHLVPSLCVVVLFIGFLVLYYGSFFGPRGQHANTALEYGSRISRSFGWSSIDNREVGESKESILGQEGGEDGLIPKSFPVSEF